MFIELTNMQGHKILLNLGHIRYIMPNGQHSTVYCVSFGYSSTDFIYKVQESFDTIKQMVKQVKP